MDLFLAPYNHELHFPHMWPLFLHYLEEVKKEPMSYHTALSLEKWILGLPGSIKIAWNGVDGAPLGFIVYQMRYNGDDSKMWVEGLYIRPEMRYNGVTRAILASFPGIATTHFKLHKSRRECANDPMLTGMTGAQKECDDPESPHLEIWFAKLNKGSNPAMESLRNKKE